MSGIAAGFLFVGCIVVITVGLLLRGLDKQKAKTEVPKPFPSVLWLLPIVFGVVGGTIAAVIAGTTYRATWSGLFFLGLFITFIGIFIGLLLAR